MSSEPINNGTEWNQRIRFVVPPPLLEWGHVAFHALSSSRSALDMTFVRIAQGLSEFSRDQERKLAFPILDSEAEFRKWAGKRPWLPKPVLDKIEEWQPFAGRQSTRDLRQLTNCGKHRQQIKLSIGLRSMRWGAKHPHLLRFERNTQAPIDDGTVICRLVFDRPTSCVATGDTYILEPFVSIPEDSGFKQNLLPLRDVITDEA